MWNILSCCLVKDKNSYTFDAEPLQVKSGTSADDTNEPDTAGEMALNKKEVFEAVTVHAELSGWLQELSRTDEKHNQIASILKKHNVKADVKKKGGFTKLFGSVNAIESVKAELQSKFIDNELMPENIASGSGITVTDTSSAIVDQENNKPSTSRHLEILDMEEYMWRYILFKHKKLLESLDVADGLQCRFCQDESGRHQLEVSYPDKKKLDEVCEAVADVCRTMVETNVVEKEVALLERTDENLIRKELEDMGVIFIAPSSCRLIGPSEDVIRAQLKLMHLLSLCGRDEPFTGDVNPKTLESEYDMLMIETPSGCQVHVHQGNLVTQQTEAIVNPANVDLAHGSGAAAAIAEAAGPRMISECHEYTRKHRHLETSQPMHTSAGNLFPPIRFIIHCAGPDSRRIKDDKKCFSLLRDAFSNCLFYANDQLKISSLALPAISSGIYGIEKAVVARAAYEGLMYFDKKMLSRKSSKRNLLHIHFVNIDPESTEVMANVMRQCSESDPINMNPTTLHQNNSEADEVTANPPKIPVVHVVSATSDGDDSHSNGVHESNQINHGSSYAEVVKGHSGDASQPSDLCNSDSSHPDSANIFKTQESVDDDEPEGDELTNQSSESQTRSTKRAKERILKPQEAHGVSKCQNVDDCVICMDKITDPKELDCGHTFCTECIVNYFENYQPKCPSCGTLFGALRGNQPPGRFRKRVVDFSLAGYKRHKTIEITYTFESGHQQDDQPNPGKWYKGVTRTAYLPDSPEGREVCDLLEHAFEARLVFTIGRSVTTGHEGVIVWNDIHHKTKPDGPYGYPDPTYLQRVKEELATKGIVPLSNFSDEINGTLPSASGSSVDNGKATPPASSSATNGNALQPSSSCAAEENVPSSNNCEANEKMVSNSSANGKSSSPTSSDTGKASSHSSCVTTDGEAAGQHSQQTLDGAGKGKAPSPPSGGGKHSQQTSDGAGKGKAPSPPSSNGKNSQQNSDGAKKGTATSKHANNKNGKSGKNCKNGKH